MEINEKHFKWVALHEQGHHKRDHAMKFSLSWDTSLSQQTMMCFNSSYCWPKQVSQRTLSDYSLWFWTILP